MPDYSIPNRNLHSAKTRRPINVFGCPQLSLVNQTLPRPSACGYSRVGCGRSRASGTPPVATAPQQSSTRSRRSEVKE